MKPHLSACLRNSRNPVGGGSLQTHGGPGRHPGTLSTLTATGSDIFHPRLSGQALSGNVPRGNDWGALGRQVPSPTRRGGHLGPGPNTATLSDGPAGGVAGGRLRTIKGQAGPWGPRRRQVLPREQYW